MRKKSKSVARSMFLVQNTSNSDGKTLLNDQFDPLNNFQQVSTTGSLCRGSPYLFRSSKTPLTNRKASVRDALIFRGLNVWGASKFTICKSLKFTNTMNFRRAIVCIKNNLVWRWTRVGRVQKAERATSNC